MQNRILSIVAVMVAAACVLTIARHFDWFRIGAATVGAPVATPAPAAGAGDATVVPTLPARRPRPGAPPLPPALPPGADHIAPLTLDMAIRRQAAAGGVQIARQTITRTATRIHVAPMEGPEWLYVRNPLDPRRVSGYLIDHAERAIVVHSDGDLRNQLAIDGWADVLSLGIAGDVLADLPPAGEVRTIDGIPFILWRRSEASRGRGEIWWNAEHLLPAAFTAPDARMSFSLSAIRTGIDDEVLRAPESRFPAYRAVNLPDWLEHH